MSTLQERLAVAMEGPPSVSAADLARACGVKGASVSEWINGPTKSLRGPNAIKAAKRLGVNVEWLSTGSGPMRSGGAPPPVVASPETRPGYVRAEQLAAEGEMGTGAINDEVPEVIRAIDYTPSYIRAVMGFVPPPGRLVLITGRGNSMMPVIQPGDSILVDMGIKEFDGDGLYLINSGMGEQVKALQDRGGAIYVVSANSELFPAYPASKETRVLGKVYLRNRVDRFN
ncbi:helix-turn-helix transcriptional regulator [Rhodanobacter glycinis]|uniref:Helix-turn-helix transcriptional regulator n=1 Tax=Rhodanobacter glycinis TaxID=582702 RepID=A0A5B9DY71_9GAMM|nr:S24 family peptidase [Rhodanobacter glycinis]QEE24499.1 helix-turn-helix transcriptional regulator [Rhodanobacter glycinis]